MPENLSHVIHDIRAFLAGDGLPDDEYPLHAVRRLAGLDEQPVRLAHKALGTVAVDRIVERLLGNDDAGLTVGAWSNTSPRDHETPLERTPQVEDMPVLRSWESRGQNLTPA